MSAALNSVVALAYWQELTQTGYNRVEYAVQDSPACWMGHSGPVIRAWAPKYFARDLEFRFCGLSWGEQLNGVSGAGVRMRLSIPPR